MDQNVGAPGQGDQGRTGAGVAAVNDHTPLAWQVELHPKADVRRAVLDRRGQDSESSGPEDLVSLLCRDIVQLDPVWHLLLQREQVHEPAEDLHGVGQGVHVKCRPPPGQPHVVRQRGDAVHVIHVAVRDDQRGDPHGLQPRLQNLLVRASRAVHQHDLVLRGEGQGRVVPAGRWDGPGRSEELEGHGDLLGDRKPETPSESPLFIGEERIWIRTSGACTENPSQRGTCYQSLFQHVHENPGSAIALEARSRTCGASQYGNGTRTQLGFHGYSQTPSAAARTAQSPV